MAFNGVIVDLGQSISRPSHYLVKFWVPQAADDALENKKQTDRQKRCGEMLRVLSKAGLNGSLYLWGCFCLTYCKCV